MAMPRQAGPDWKVAEIQGLYGPFTFSERLLQKIWLRAEFDTAHAMIADGRPLRVLHPGSWNLLGGPDFRGARLRLDDQDVVGDVELHLHAGDWATHAHSADRAYDGVVLHVVLFPPVSGEQARRADQSPIPTLVLLPLLLHDLEEYAAEDAVEALACRTDWRATEELARLPAGEVRAVLQTEAERRWRQKALFARRRVERLGWSEACHQTALEILGYRFNRVPMLKIAVRAPLPAWVGRPVDIEALLSADTAPWSLQGGRPANHPRVRLRQYATWAGAVPDWPGRLAQLAEGIPALPGDCVGGPTPLVRRQLGLTALRARLAKEITSGAVGGTRFDNLVCDGFLPLLAARAERSFFPQWFHWFAGDLPARLIVVLRSLGVFQGRAQPACHGFAQGLLGWMLARESPPVPPGGRRPEVPGEPCRPDPGAHGALSGQQVRQENGDERSQNDRGELGGAGDSHRALQRTGVRGLQEDAKQHEI